MQTRRGSAIETSVNISIGFITSVLMNNILLPWMGFDISMSQSIFITIVFTIISTIRSYAVRRMFNYLSVRFKF